MSEEKPVLDAIESIFADPRLRGGLIIPGERITNKELLMKQYEDTGEKIWFFRWLASAKNRYLIPKTTRKAAAKAEEVLTEAFLPISTDPSWGLSYKPVLIRRGLACPKGYPYGFNFQVGINNLQERRLPTAFNVDDVIKSGNYSVFFSMDYRSNDKTGFFLMAVDRKNQGGIEKNIVRVADAGSIDSPAIYDNSAVVRPEIDAIYKSLERLAKEIPAGSDVNPEMLAMRFIRALR